MWTSEKVENLIQYAKLGMSMAEIAGKLKTTRNTIIGKLYRLKVNKKPSTQAKSKAISKFAFPNMPLSGCLYHCDKEGWCGCETVQEKPWCLKHINVVYQKPTPRLDVRSIIRAVK